MSKYNEVMDNLVITDEMKKRLLENIEKEVAADNNDEGGPENETYSYQTVNISDYDKKKNGSSGKIVKFISRYGSKAAVFALIALGSVGVIRLVGLNGEKSYESASTADNSYDSVAEESSQYSEPVKGGLDKQSPEGNNQTGSDLDSIIEEPESYDSVDSSRDEEGKFEISESDSAKNEAAETEAAAEPMDKLTITMAGDVLIHTPIAEAAEDSDGNYNFDFLFANTTDEISAADIAIVNQEVILGGKELGVTGYPSFNAPYELGDALVNAGFNVICHATNHALDKGKKGILNACNFWKNTYPNITVAGINETREEYDKVRIVEKNGMKIAILNYTYGTNGISLPSDMPYAVNLLEEEKVIADLEYAEKNADFTVVCPHWGTEYSHGIDDMQRKWTEIFRENGADLVIGTHPHVIEPIEMLEDSDRRITNNHGNGDMLVYYSIGNFVNWTSDSGSGIADRMVGGLADITLRRDANGEVVIDDYGIKPVVSHVEEGPEKVTVYLLSDYTNALAAKNEIIKQDPEFTKNYCAAICEDIWGDLLK